MSNFNAKSEAVNRIARMPIPQGDEPLTGLTVTLLAFETDGVAAGLVGGNSAQFQAMVIKAQKKLLRQRGAIVKVATIQLNTVLQWAGDEPKPLTLLDRLVFVAEMFNAAIRNHRVLPVRNDDFHQQLQQFIKDAKASIFLANETPAVSTAFPTSAVFTALEESENARHMAEEQLVQAKAKPIQFAISQWRKKLTGQNEPRYHHTCPIVPASSGEGGLTP